MILQLGQWKKEVSDVWFTSDTHFNHENIIKFCERPFKSTAEMDNILIENWNSIIKEDDIIFHLGDVCFGGLPKWEEILSQLNGIKYLCLGNHDMKQIKNLHNNKRLMNFFDGISHQYGIMIDNRKIYLNHHPFLCYGGTYRNKNDMVYMLHGHVHLSNIINTGKDFNIMKTSFPTLYDVGVDANYFKPISFSEIDKKISYQIDNNVNQATLLDNIINNGNISRNTDKTN